MKIQNVNLHHSLEYTFRIAINEYVLYIQVIQATPITAQWLISKNVPLPGDKGQINEVRDGQPGTETCDSPSA